MSINIKEVIKEWDGKFVMNFVEQKYARFGGYFEAINSKKGRVDEIKEYLKLRDKAILHSHSQDLIERINNKYASMDDKDLREEIIRLVENEL